VEKEACKGEERKAENSRTTFHLPSRFASEQHERGPAPG
jgi:hypothetical protein